MHQMITEIIVDGIIEDQYVTPFGIRTLYFDADKGLLINKEHIKIHGMAIHNEAGQLGAAVPIKVWKRRFEKLKGMGCNAIRTAHNPAYKRFRDNNQEGQESSLCYFMECRQ